MNAPAAMSPLVGVFVLLAIGVLCVFWMGSAMQQGAPLVEVGIRGAVGAIATWLGAAIAFKVG